MVESQLGSQKELQIQSTMAWMKNLNSSGYLIDVQNQRKIFSSGTDSTTRSDLAPIEWVRKNVFGMQSDGIISGGAQEIDKFFRKAAENYVNIRNTTPLTKQDALASALNQALQSSGSALAEFNISEITVRTTTTNPFNPFTSARLENDPSFKNLI